MDLEPFILYIQTIQKEPVYILEEHHTIAKNLTFDIDSNFKFWDSINHEPEKNLFYWCILSNRIEIAKIFWKLGKVSSIII